MTQQGKSKKKTKHLFLLNGIFMLYIKKLMLQCALGQFTQIIPHFFQNSRSLALLRSQNPFALLSVFSCSPFTFLCSKFQMMPFYPA